MPEKKVDFSLADPEIAACPFDVYRILQEERPIYRDPVTGFYEVTRAAEIKIIAANPKVFSNRHNRQSKRSSALQAEIAELYRQHGYPHVRTLLDNDPPNHRTLRTLVDRAFSEARTRALVPSIHAEVSRLLDAFEDRTSIEFVSEFAVPMPLNIIADQLGLERSKREIIKTGSDALIGVADPLTADRDILGYVRSVVAMQCLLADRIKSVKEAPDDTLLSVVSNLIDDEGKRLDLGTLVHLFQSILVAGNETTTNAVGSAVKLLVDGPDIVERLRLDANLVPNFVEETLRLRSPLQGFFRLATAETMIGDVLIPEGATVMLRWGAANRDPERFDCPSELDLGRKNIGQHFAFGHGSHFCIGNRLARAELCAAIEQIVQRWTNIRLAESKGSVAIRRAFFTHGPDHLSIRFDKIAPRSRAS